MAANPVKFYNVTKSEYDGISAEKKVDGNLYFISDNGEIRKGANHAVGARVYTAEDTTGTSAVSALTIKLNGKDVGTETPRFGDALIVSHPLAAGTEYTAYLYNTNGGTYSAAGWIACDGNVDASKVVLTSDISLAGSYTTVGNVDKSETTKFAAGKSIASILSDIFNKRLDDAMTKVPYMTWVTDGGNASLEYGASLASRTYKVQWNDGDYTYHSYDDDTKAVVTATGAAPKEWTISAYDGKTATNATISADKTTAEIKTDAIDHVTSGKTLVSFSVSNNLDSVRYAADNLGGKGTPKISKENAVFGKDGSTKGKEFDNSANSTSITRSLTVYHNYFWGSSTTGEKADWQTVDADGKATVATNNNIRGLNKGTTIKDAASGNVAGKMSVVANASNIIIAIPKDKTLTEVLSFVQGNFSILGNFTENMVSVKVGGGDSTETSVGDYTYEYKVYVYHIASPGAADTLTVTISNAS